MLHKRAAKAVVALVVANLEPSKQRIRSSDDSALIEETRKPE